MAYNPNIPNQSNNALTDIAGINTNFQELRKHECGAAGPANPAAGMLWADNSGSELALYIRNKNNTAYRVVDFPPGTVLGGFYQAAAPLGWTQVVTQNDKALRVVSGAGGGSGGSRVLSSASVGDTAISVAQMPAHNHAPSGHCHYMPSYLAGGPVNYYNPGGANTGNFYPEGYCPTSVDGGQNTLGGDAAHNHPLALAYIDVIICSKN